MAETAKATRVVDRSDDGLAWSIRVAQGSAPIATARTKREAIEQATTQLRASPGGGELHIFLGDGRPEAVRRISPIPTASTRPSDPHSSKEVLQQIHDEGEHVDKGLELVIAVVGFTVVSTGSAFISPEVREAAGEGWIQVFLATLTWSLGCAFAVIVLRRSGLMGWPLANAILFGFVVALGIARFLGTGVVDVDSAYAASPNLPGPLKGIAAFVAIAFWTYGLFGAFLGGAVGAWLGYRLSALVPEDWAI